MVQKHFSAFKGTVMEGRTTSPVGRRSSAAAQCVSHRSAVQIPQQVGASVTSVERGRCQVTHDWILSLQFCLSFKYALGNGLQSL